MGSPVLLEMERKGNLMVGWGHGNRPSSSLYDWEGGSLSVVADSGL